MTSEGPKPQKAPEGPGKLWKTLGIPGRLRKALVDTKRGPGGLGVDIDILLLQFPHGGGEPLQPDPDHVVRPAPHPGAGGDDPTGGGQCFLCEPRNLQTVGDFKRCYQF